jgi:hypothetical protein
LFLFVLHRQNELGLIDFGLLLLLLRLMAIIVQSVRNIAVFLKERAGCDQQST